MDRVTVVAINLVGTLAEVENFVAVHDISFTVLRDGPFRITIRHYEIQYWSDTWLLDRWGNRVGEEAIQFSASRFEQLLAALEESTS